MREESNGYMGVSVVLERKEDLSLLPAATLRRIPSAPLEIFRHYPDSVHSLAAAVGFPALQAWLQRVAKAGHCELGIHEPGPGFEEAASEVLLEVYRVSRGVKGSPVRFSGGLSRVPERCPPTLMEVLRRVGVVVDGYGGAGRLLRGSEQRTVTSLRSDVAERDSDFRKIYRKLGRAQVAPRAYELPVGAKGAYAFYQDSSGDYMVTSRVGKTWSFATGSGEMIAGRPIDEWLTEFFERSGV